MVNARWMKDPVALVVNALAAYRLTRLWTRDSLPPIPKIRQHVLDKLNAVQDAKGSPESHPLTKLVDCPWCIGFWISAGVVLAATLAPRAWRPLAVALAFSAVVGNIATREQGDD